MLHKFVLYSIAKDRRTLQYVFANFAEFERFYNKYSPNNIKVVFPTATTARTIPTGRAASDAFAAHLAGEDSSSESSENNDADNMVDDSTMGTIHTMRITDEQLYPNTFTIPTVTAYQKLLYHLFTASWAAYLTEHNSKMLNNKLQRYAVSAIASKQTDDVTKILNSQPTVDPTTLKDLIRQNVEQETKALKETIRRLEQQSKRSVKKDTRGDKVTSRASPKKKPKNTNNNKNKRTPTRQQQQASTPSKKRTKPIAKTQSAGKRKQKPVDTADAAEPATQAKKRKKKNNNTTKKLSGTSNKQQRK
jgi:hypothetical protein